MPAGVAAYIETGPGSRDSCEGNAHIVGKPTLFSQFQKKSAALTPQCSCYNGKRMSGRIMKSRFPRNDI